MLALACQWSPGQGVTLIAHHGCGGVDGHEEEEKQTWKDKDQTSEVFLSCHEEEPRARGSGGSDCREPLCSSVGLGERLEIVFTSLQPVAAGSRKELRASSPRVPLASRDACLSWEAVAPWPDLCLG